MGRSDELLLQLQRVVQGAGEQQEGSGVVGSAGGSGGGGREPARGGFHGVRVHKAGAAEEPEQPIDAHRDGDKVGRRVEEHGDRGVEDAEAGEGEFGDQHGDLPQDRPREGIRQAGDGDPAPEP